MIAIASVLVIGLVASSARAVDGVVEIHQACASGPGCFAGDGRGLPVRVTTSGSDRLTSDLVPPDQNTNVISAAGGGLVRRCVTDSNGATGITSTTAATAATAATDLAVEG